MAERKRMTTRFKELFEQQKFFVMAGGMNPIGAKMAEALGYEVFYMSGGNTAAHQLGWPDSGSSMRDMVDNARKIVLTVNIPVFSDADTGYGDAVNTHRTVQEYINAGIAGCHIEDQTFPPKSGPRRRCVSIQELVGKLKAAMDAKMEFDPDFVIMARCDFRSEEHTSELQSLRHLVCRLLLEKKKNRKLPTTCMTIPKAPEEPQTHDDMN